MRSRFDWLAVHAAFLVPWILGLLQVSTAPSWSADRALVRTFAESPLGMEGLVSAALSGLVSFIPVGSALTRAASVSALALGAAGLCIYRLSARWLSRSAPGRSLNPAIALLSALTATLGSSFVAAGSVAGGAAVAAALALLAIDLASAGFSRRSGIAVGGLVALTFCESRLTAVVLALALLVLVLGRGRSLPRSFLAWAGAGAAGVSLLPLAVVVSLLLSPGRSFAELFSTSGAPLSFSLHRVADVIANWTHGAGFVFGAVALLGVVLGLLDRASRGLVCCLVAFLAAGAFCPETAPPTDADPHEAVRLLGLAVLAISTSAGLSFLVHGLSRARLPFARAASVLLVVYGFSLVFVSAEDASRTAEGREASLAERWTDEAWLSLPPKSLLLVRSEAVFLRLLASRTLSGARPDVLLVPTTALDQSSVRLDLVEQEAALVPIVRDVLLAGKPSELALTGLADARPMYVELDPNWEARLYPHLVPHAFFSEFAPHPLGRSDRTAGVEGATRSFDEVAAAVRSTPDRDPATRQVLSASLSERAILLEALGDRTAAAAVTDALLELAPKSAVGLALRSRFERKSRDALDVRALLASR